jgi:type II secretory pathway component PulJ
VEEIIKSFLKDTPTIAAMLVMAWWFLNALERQNVRYEKLEERHEEARTHSRAVIEANTQVLTRVVETMRKCDAK